ncbi:Protein NBR1 [Phytophthora citrophthora]|uniref:Protein NBR1 n=1 Tax=Phytophthora citrophthora TaxID=4793 RepID=A0AAD9GUD5_9STRA|nr:Protein NBR1 [Phytophthora citrophthora]
MEGKVIVLDNEPSTPLALASDSGELLTMAEVRLWAAQQVDDAVKDFSLSYMDSENDQVTITSDTDVKELANYMVDEKLERVKVFVAPKESTGRTVRAVQSQLRGLVTAMTKLTTDKPKQPTPANAMNLLVASLQTMDVSEDSAELAKVKEQLLEVLEDEEFKKAVEELSASEEFKELAEAMVTAIYEEDTQAIEETATARFDELLVFAQQLVKHCPDLKPTMINVAKKCWSGLVRGNDEELENDGSASSSSSCSSSSSSGVETEEVPVHFDVVCDGCDKDPLVGVRYKSLEVPNFDLCENCEASGKWASHEPFIKITDPTRAPKHTRSPELLVHPFVVCDGCEMSPLVGPRFKSKTAEDFDLCQDCEASGKWTESHGPFTKIDEPGMMRALKFTCRRGGKEDRHGKFGHHGKFGRHGHHHGKFGHHHHGKFGHHGHHGEFGHHGHHGPPGIPFGTPPTFHHEADITFMQRPFQEENGFRGHGAPPFHHEDRGFPGHGPPPSRRSSWQNGGGSWPGNPGPSCGFSDLGSRSPHRDGPAEFGRHRPDFNNPRDHGFPPPPPEFGPRWHHRGPPEFGPRCFGRFGSPPFGFHGPHGPPPCPPEFAPRGRPDCHGRRGRHTRFPYEEEEQDEGDCPRRRREYRGRWNHETSNLAAQFLEDVTIEDGTVVEAGKPVHKMWKLVNDGERVWPDGCYMIAQPGNPLFPEGSESSRIDLPALAPGEEFIAGVDLVAPMQAGRYTSFWRVCDPADTSFGHRFWIDIVVAGDATPDLASSEASTEDSGEDSEMKDSADAALQADSASDDDIEIIETAEAEEAETVNGAAVSADETDDESQSLFSESLKMLAAMGFSDSSKNLRALELADGNIGSAVNMLLTE